MVRIGVGGWNFEGWRKGAFYPADLAQSRELAWASQRLNAVEINATYYGPQSPASFARWHDETPADFVFAVKGPRFTTMRRDLAEAGESIGRFLDGGVMNLGDKLGPICWQFLPTRRFAAEEFEIFLALLPAQFDGRPLRHAVEVRHDSFVDPAFTALARDYGVAVVCAGDSAYPQIADTTAPFVYARIMGTQEGEPAGYDAAALDRWAARARTWAQGGTPADLQSVAPAPSTPPDAPRDVFLFVISGAKPRNPAAAMALLERLQRG